MHFILNLLISAGVLVVLAYLMPQVEIKNYGTAIIVAILIGLLNATVGFLLRLPLNILTLGLLSFFVKLLVSAVVIKIVDALVGGFKVRGFLAALILAAGIALASTLIDRAFRNDTTTNPRLESTFNGELRPAA
jgi:putative membrane protein